MVKYGKILGHQQGFENTSVDPVMQSGRSNNQRDLCSLLSSCTNARKIAKQKVLFIIAAPSEGTHPVQVLQRFKLNTIKCWKQMETNVLFPASRVLKDVVMDLQVRFFA